MVDVKQAIYNTIAHILDEVKEQRPNVSQGLLCILQDLKEDFPEIYDQAVEDRYCHEHDI
jgi:hypothetical protein